MDGFSSCYLWWRIWKANTNIQSTIQHCRTSKLQCVKTAYTVFFSLSFSDFRDCMIRSWKSENDLMSNDLHGNYKFSSLYILLNAPIFYYTFFSDIWYFGKTCYGEFGRRYLQRYWSVYAIHSLWVRHVLLKY